MIPGQVGRKHHSRGVYVQLAVADGPSRFPPRSKKSHNWGFSLLARLCALLINFSGRQSSPKPGREGFWDSDQVTRAWSRCHHRPTIRHMECHDNVAMASESIVPRTIQQKQGRPARLYLAGQLHLNSPLEDQDQESRPAERHVVAVEKLMAAGFAANEAPGFGAEKEPETPSRRLRRASKLEDKRVGGGGYALVPQTRIVAGSVAGEPGKCKIADQLYEVMNLRGCQRREAIMRSNDHSKASPGSRLCCMLGANAFPTANRHRRDSPRRAATHGTADVPPLAIPRCRRRGCTTRHHPDLQRA